MVANFQYKFTPKSFFLRVHVHIPKVISKIERSTKLDLFQYIFPKFSNQPQVEPNG